MAGLEHIQEGVAYKDGEETQLYDPNDAEALEAVLFQKCVSYSIGPLTINACIDTSVPSASLTVTLLGTTLASCTLSPDHPSCQIGGSIDGFKAQIDVTFSASPLSVTVTGELCAPIVGCKKFSHTFTF